MKYAKVLAVFLLPLFLVSWLCSQDLTAAAKKEKERREAAKNKKVTVITNADLQSVKKKPAVSGGEAQDQKAEGETTPGTPAEAANPEGTAPAEENTAAQPETEEPMPVSTPLPTQADNSQSTALETTYLKAKEYADLLETRLNGLWQEFYSMDDMQPKDQIQQQIADTFDKYQKARDDETRAKEELDRYLSTIKKD